MAVAGAATPAPTPAPDPQAVVVEVATPTSPVSPTPPSEPCQTLGRSDVDYELVDISEPPQRRGITGWTAPVRLDTLRPPVRAVVSLREGVVLPSGVDCRYEFSLASYDAEGATWETSGSLALRDHATGVVSGGSPRLTLVVDPPLCEGQVELHVGATRYDGTQAPLPAYPTPLPAAVSIATWNGERECTGPGVVADLALEPVAPCPDDAERTWRLLNPNVRAVAVDLTAEGSAQPFSTTLLAAPGPTTVVVAAPP